VFNYFVRNTCGKVLSDGTSLVSHHCFHTTHVTSDVTVKTRKQLVFNDSNFWKISCESLFCRSWHGSVI